MASVVEAAPILDKPAMEHSVSDDRAALEERCEKVRSEIKTWERDHLAKTGRKATRDDVKADPTIVAKYELYENIRAKLSGRKQPHRKPSQKRKRDSAGNEEEPITPSKRVAKVVSTPRKTSIAETQDVDVEDTPQQPRPLMLGPTPQKNGIFISLFSHIPASPINSPSRKVLSELQLTSTTANVTSTPSKGTKTAAVPMTPTTTSRRDKYTRTPMSSGRRHFLDLFVTPRKRKADEEQERTPNSIAKKFATPSFFKQYTNPVAMESVAEENEGDGEEVIIRRVPRKPMLKTLSIMIREIREKEEKDEERRMDDDLDVLRDLEQDDAGPAQKKVQGNSEKDNDLDQDGFLEADVRAELDTIQEEAEKHGERDNMFRKVWKKKGQKRTTKRVIMRPTRTKPGESTTEAFESGDENGSDVDLEANRQNNDKAFEPGKTNKKAAPAKSKGKTRKATDDANFRRLKIKQKNPKGNGRFSRRR